MSRSSAELPGPHAAALGGREKVFLILGKTGVGKSHFVRAASRDESVEIGHSLTSHTQDVREVSYDDPVLGGRIVLVDTPGFDDTRNVGNDKTLERIAAWLQHNYQSGIYLTGILYLHNINDNRMSNSALTSLGIFMDMCGEDSFRHVTLVTTMDDSTSINDEKRQSLESRRQELITRYWGSIRNHGAQVFDFDGTPESAQNVLVRFRDSPKFPLKMQIEMGAGVPIPRTTVGRRVYNPVVRFFLQMGRSIRDAVVHPRHRNAHASPYGGSGGQSKRRVRSSSQTSFGVSTSWTEVEATESTTTLGTQGSCEGLRREIRAVVDRSSWRSKGLEDSDRFNAAILVVMGFVDVVERNSSDQALLLEAKEVALLAEELFTGLSVKQPSQMSLKKMRQLLREMDKIADDIHSSFLQSSSSSLGANPAPEFSRIVKDQLKGSLHKHPRSTASLSSLFEGEEELETAISHILTEKPLLFFDKLQHMHTALNELVYIPPPIHPIIPDDPDRPTNTIDYYSTHRRNGISSFALVNPDSRILSMPTVLVFGTTGVGKSSLINMLANAPGHGDDIAPAGSQASGMTAETRAFYKLIGSQHYRVFDTIGTGEADHGTVPTDVAIQALFQLLIQPHGVNLMVLVVRAGRLLRRDQNNYELLKLLCAGVVPLALVVTGLENEQNPEGWWERQRERAYKFEGHACVVSSPGLNGNFQEAFEDSKLRLEELIERLARRNHTFNPPSWRREIFARLVALIGTRARGSHQKAALTVLQGYGCDVPRTRHLAMTIPTLNRK